MTTQQQRAEALERANEARSRTAVLCARVRAQGVRGGAHMAADIVLAGESQVRFERLLMAVPRVGRVKARRMLALAQINATGALRVCDVGPDRRRLLAGELLKHAERWRDA